MSKILLPVLLVIAMIGCNSYTDFEREPTLEEKFDTSTYWQDEARDSLLISGIRVEQGLNAPNYYEIKDIETQKKITYAHPFLIADITNSTFITISGNAAFDSGLRYLLFPNYSRLMLIEKESLDVLLDIKIDEIVSNAKVVDKYIYFWYRDDQGYEVSYSLGRVRIE